MHTLLAPFNARLCQLIPDEPEQTLFTMARYSLEGGKRLRPLLTLLVGHLYERPLEPFLDPACALELLHSYSLIHDDLPCMDDDDYRRGRPSLHRAFSEAGAILTGDFLLTYAFEVLAKAPHLSEGQRMQLILELSKSAGAEGMVGGQVLDVGGSRDFLLTHTKKTAALISASLGFGAIVAGAPVDEQEALRKAGLALGIAFQFRDDLEDGKGAVGVLGREEMEKIIERQMYRAKAFLNLPGKSTMGLLGFFDQMIYGQAAL
jgi:geranylgeranyl diphosphate synthase type II